MNNLYRINKDTYIDIDKVSSISLINNPHLRGNNWQAEIILENREKFFSKKFPSRHKLEDFIYYHLEFRLDKIKEMANNT